MAMRCEDSGQIHVLSVIQETNFSKPSYEIIVNKVERAGNNIVFMKVMTWSEDGHYNFHSPPGRPLCTGDDLAFAIQVNGKTLLMTQHGDYLCRTTFEPVMKGSGARQQRWRSIFSTGKGFPLCYSYEYRLLGGKSRDEFQVLRCRDDYSNAQNSFLEPPTTQNAGLRFGGGASQSSWTVSTRFAQGRGERAPGPPAPRNAANQSSGPKLGSPEDEGCVNCEKPRSTIYLESASASNKGTCISADWLPRYFVTLVPFNVTVTCKGQNKKLSIKEAIALYREPYIYTQGCSNERLARSGDRSGFSTNDCLFIELDDCSGYSPRNCRGST